MDYEQLINEKAEFDKKVKEEIKHIEGQIAELHEKVNRLKSLISTEIAEPMEPKKKRGRPGRKPKHPKA